MFKGRKEGKEVELCVGSMVAKDWLRTIIFEGKEVVVWVY
jgi:hypothetical protein